MIGLETIQIMVKVDGKLKKRKAYIMFSILALIVKILRRVCLTEIFAAKAHPTSLKKSSYKKLMI